MWVGKDLTTNNVNTSNVVMIRSANAALLALRPFTVVRSHVFLSLQSDQVIATEDQQVAFGGCVVSDQAVAIGVTAVPTPLTDLGSDLWYMWKMLQNSFALLSAIGVATNFNKTWEIDSKAMRKVEDGQDIIDVFEVASTSDGLSLTSVGRMLLKLH